jgi:WD40 repeat protein
LEPGRTTISRFKRPGAIGYRTLAFLPNSQIVTFADKNDVNSSSLLGIYDSDTGRLMRRVSRQPGEQSGRMLEVAVTSDGRYIVVLTDKVRSSMPIYDTVSLENIGWVPLPAEARARTLAPGPGSKLAFGVFIIGLAGARKNIHVYDIGARTAGLVMPAHIPNVESIAWSPAGRLIASGASGLGLVGDGKGWFRDVDPLRVWDSASGSLVRSFEGFLDGVSQITWHPAGNIFATTGRRSETELGAALRLWSPSKSSALSVGRYGRTRYPGSETQRLRIAERINAGISSRTHRPARISPAIPVSNRTMRSLHAKETATRWRCRADLVELVRPAVT